MNQSSQEEIVKKIASIIGNRPLATAIHRSVASALEYPFVHFLTSAHF